MNILSRLPEDVLSEIRRLDPTAGQRLDRPSIDEVIGRADPRVLMDPADDLLVAPPPPRTAGRETGAVTRRSRRRVAIAAVVAVAAAVGALVINAWPVSTATGDRSATAPAATATADSGALPSDARLWSRFPVDRTPRPVVLTGPDVVDPAGGFPDQDTKLAYLDRHLRVPAELPASPASVDGYPITTARDAVDELTGGADSVADPAALQITKVTLAQHDFLTDRGTQDLPAWAIRIAGITDPAYVLAVGPEARFAYPNTDESGLSSRHLGVSGNLITFALTPSHASSGPCDPAFTETAAIEQTPTVVTLTVTRTVASSPSATGSLVHCNFQSTLEPDPDLTPGSAGTQTITLSDALGNRPVVDSADLPWVVDVRR